VYIHIHEVVADQPNAVCLLFVCKIDRWKPVKYDRLCWLCLWIHAQQLIKWRLVPCTILARTHTLAPVLCTISCLDAHRFDRCGLVAETTTTIPSFAISDKVLRALASYRVELGCNWSVAIPDKVMRALASNRIELDLLSRVIASSLLATETLPFQTNFHVLSREIASSLTAAIYR